MQTRLVTFYGGEPGSDGLPKHFHRYLIIASAGAMVGATASVALVVALTSAPKPSLAHFVVQKGSETHAIDKAVAAIGTLPGNKGLQTEAK